MQTALLLSRRFYDSPEGTRLSFWWHSNMGAVHYPVLQPSVCFLPLEAVPRVQKIVQTLSWPIELRPLSMRLFTGEQAAACYVPQSYLARWRELMQEQGISLYEADIRPDDRYLMERFIYGQGALYGEFQLAENKAYYELKQGRIQADKTSTWQPHLRMLSVDIETSYPKINQPDRLFSIALYAKDYSCVFMLGEGKNQNQIQYFPDEKSLLTAFLVAVKNYNPDALIGWNIVQFDMAFLAQKFQEHELAFTLGRDDSVAELWRSDEQTFIYVAGRVVLDGIALLKQATFQFESYRLNAVAKEVLNDEKLLNEQESSDDIEYLFEHNKPHLAAYNLKDCILVWDVFSKLKLLDFAIERSRITGLALDRMGGSVAAFENLYLPKLHRAGFIAPNRGDGLYLESPGGYVLDSTPGFFEHVLVLDFKSLYPSIIRTFAIDPLALHQGLMASNAEETVPGFMGARFWRDQPILPSIIADLAEKREKAKAERNTALSNAIKIIMASFYGVLGTEGCRLADSRLTASITLRGHEIILTSSAWVKKQGYQIIYGDTDSLFVWLNKSLSQEQAHQVGKKLAKDLNLFWQNDLVQRFGLHSHLEIQYETHYVKFFMPALRGTDEGSKKRYAGMVQQGEDFELVFKGLEAVRSDWTAFARNTQKELYRRIFRQEPYAAWLYARVQDLLSGRLDNELIYRKRLRQPLSAYAHHLPPHAQAAHKLEKWRALKGLPAHFLTRGGTVEYRLTLNGPEPLWPDGSPHSPIDYGHYLETQLRPICTAIFQFTGDDFSAITGLQLSLF